MLNCTTTYSEVVPPPTQPSYITRDTGRTVANIIGYTPPLAPGEKLTFGSSFSDTFDLPDGYWICAEGYVDFSISAGAASGKAYSYTLTAEYTITPKGSGDKLTFSRSQTFTSDGTNTTVSGDPDLDFYNNVESNPVFYDPYPNVVGTFPDNPDKPYNGPGKVLFQGYPTMGGLWNGATVDFTVTVTGAQTCTNSYRVLATLTSILPTAPNPHENNFISGPPDAGSASVAIDPNETGDQIYQETFFGLYPVHGNGLAPFTYLWTVYDQTPRPPYPTAQIDTPTASAMSWTLPGCSGAETNCVITNARFPHQVGAAAVGYGGLGIRGAAAPPPAPAPLPSGFLALDAHRRPLAATAGPQTAALGLCSNDAGHAFQSSAIDPDQTCADISLLVDTHVNRFTAIYTKGASGKTQFYRAAGPITDTFTPDAPPAVIAGISVIAGASGTYPICASHPTDRLFALMVFVSGGSLVAAQSGDGGNSWEAAGAIAAGVDLMKSGRAGLCWLGGMAFCAYGAGTAVACAASRDRGQAWTTAGSAGADGKAGSSGPYSGLSLLGWQGTLYLLAFTVPADSSSSPVPSLFISHDLAQTWTAAAAKLPALTPPSAIGVIPSSSQLRLDTRYKSDNDGAAWISD